MKDWLKNNIMSTLSLGAIIGAAYYSSELKQLMFSDLQIKYKTESHVQNTDDLTVYKNRQKDSMAEVRHRAFQDSIDMVRDTLTKRTAVTAYQNKEKVDTLVNLVLEMKKNLDHALEHIE